jgi:hypothetical protein
MNAQPLQMSWVLEQVTGRPDVGEWLVHTLDGGRTRQDVCVLDDELHRIGPGPVKVRVRVAGRSRYLPVCELYREVGP